MRRATGTETQDIIYGLSTETKPTDSSIDVGVKFLETNTGKRWIYTGTAWVEDLQLIYALSQVFV